MLPSGKMLSVCTQYVSPMSGICVHSPTTATTVLQPFDWTTRKRRYQKKHSTTYTYLDHQSSFISFHHSQWSITSFLFNLCTSQPLCPTSLQVLIGLPLGLAKLQIIAEVDQVESWTTYDMPTFFRWRTSVMIQFWNLNFENCFIVFNSTTLIYANYFYFYLRH